MNQTQNTHLEFDQIEFLCGLVRHEKNQLFLKRQSIGDDFYQDKKMLDIELTNCRVVLIKLQSMFSNFINEYGYEVQK